MSLFHPETAEDKMAIVPVLGCLVPLAAAIIVVLAIVL
jgi:hypothetical protein